MDAHIDPTGMTMSRGISAALRDRGQGFALEVARCHSRFIKGDYEKMDGFNRSYYATSCGTVVFSLPKSAPWFAVVSLPQEI